MNESLNAVVRFNDSYVAGNIDAFSKRPLAALPIMVKDNILVE
jgi:Asp-tRNA(Asn)/Glu-tRNA(Gln) amidotransferase A subunit family amidase